MSDSPTDAADDSSTDAADAAALAALHEEFGTVVYDLDGTLVDLTVDWGAVADDVIAVYEDAGVTPPGDGLWDLLGTAPEFDLEAEVEAAIAAHEREGARASARLPHADALDPATAGRTAVCSLNCEDACRIALDAHGLTPGVAAVVGRDTVSTHKPDPAPLLSAVERVGGDPADAVFVGDSERDAVTAERAGLAFRWV